MGLASTAEKAMETDWQQVLRAADAALYMAKAEGRNRVAILPTVVTAGRVGHW